MHRSNFSWLLLVGLAAGLTGCGATFVNLGAKNEPLTDGLKDPSARKAKVEVPAEQCVVSTFDDGKLSINPKLLNGGAGGNWNAFSYAGNTVNDPILSDGGANGTPKCIHIFGTLTNKGDNAYPQFVLVLKPKASGFYDATAFSGLRFYYKCTAKDQTLFRNLTIPIASTLPTSAGGTCQDGCYNHFKHPLSTSPEWAIVKTPFKDFKRDPGWGAPVNPPEFTDHLDEIVDFEWGNGSGNTAGSYGVDYWVDEVEFY